MRRVYFYRALAVLYAASVFVLSVMPDSGEQGYGWDKANHFIAYAVMSFIFIRAAITPGRAFALTAFGVFIAVLFFGIGVEFVQSLTPTRHADVRDVLANGLGSVLGIAAFWFYKNRAEVKRCS
ncbi:MAG: VanZ family protein [Deltaproteobacteria bacterium]|nr:VanZ family protein [Deltaproteobacteria bacterium]